MIGELEKITLLAKEFRYAICKVKNEPDFIGDTPLSPFPKGWCDIVSDLLARYLHENGIETKSISGQFGNGWDAQNHTWLETYNGIVIDITRDQFKERNDIIFSSDEIYVGIQDSFCDAFEKSEPAPGFRGFSPYGSNKRLQRLYDRRYEMIMNQLKKHA